MWSDIILDRKNNVGKVFIHILQAIGDGHLNPAFATALSRLDKFVPVDQWTADDDESNVSADALQFFELVHVADLVHQMVDVYFVEDVVSDLFFFRI
jgi:recyclin-1